MDDMKILFFTISSITFLFAIFELISLIVNKNKTKKITGEIIDVRFVASKAMKIRNSKLVTIQYYIDNKRYISKNTVVVPMSKDVGDKIKVKYFIENPSYIYQKTINRFLVAFLIGIISLILGFYL